MGIGLSTIAALHAKEILLKFDDQSHALYGSGCQAMAAMIRAWMEGAERVSVWQLNMITATMTGNADAANRLEHWIGFSQWGDRHGHPDSRLAETGPGLARPVAAVEAIPASNEPVLQSVKKGANGSALPYPFDHSMVQERDRVPLILVSAGQATGERMRPDSAQE